MSERDNRIKLFNFDRTDSVDIPANDSDAVFRYIAYVGVPLRPSDLYPEPYMGPTLTYTYDLDLPENIEEMLLPRGVPLVSYAIVPPPPPPQVDDEELPAASVDPDWAPNIPALAEAFRETQQQIDARPAFAVHYAVFCTRNERDLDPERLIEALCCTPVRDDVFETMLRLSALDDLEVEVETQNLWARVKRGELTEDDLRDFDVLAEHAARATGNTFRVEIYDMRLQSPAKKESSET